VSVMASETPVRCPRLGLRGQSARSILFSIDKRPPLAACNAICNSVCFSFNLERVVPTGAYSSGDFPDASTGFILRVVKAVRAQEN
jgi:hypothetical protein